MDRKRNTLTTKGMEYKAPKCDIRHKERRHENDTNDRRDKEEKSKKRIKDGGRRHENDRNNEDKLENV